MSRPRAAAEESDDRSALAAYDERIETIPVEDPGAPSHWLRSCMKTLTSILARPRSSFAVCPEPVNHGRILRFLATLRFPPWVLLITILSIGFLTSDGPGPIETRSIHAFVPPALGRALSTWLVMLIPVGMPLLYFMAGLVAHIGIALTGGAPRSIGTTMRAVGFAMGPVLLAIGLLDIPLYLGMLAGQIYLAIVGVLGLILLVISGLALAKTHGISTLRGFLVALLPLTTWLAATLGRAALELDRLPGFPEPTSPYWVP